MLNRVGTLFTPFFTEHPVTNWATAKVADKNKYAAFFRAMLEGSVYLAPSQFEAGFMSVAHGDTEIEDTLTTVQRALSWLATAERT